MTVGACEFNIANPNSAVDAECQKPDGLATFSHALREDIPNWVQNRRSWA